ncbi:CYTH and CHAD domain-containing protein [Acinetobacter sp. CAAS 2-6]|uniref:CYTH and CHAD domain-containing protein n=1 Tax=Acinetobacter sp. CAAS 2-6 TaxID=3016358 RepID=UPI002DD63024|nr:CHAD domain-containing protein [Acinetobacter sp. CAAS 2-6]
MGMVEIELKFQIPEASREAVHQAVVKKQAQSIHLQAKYYDTPDRKMAAAEMALRMRKEGADWVQTFKAAGRNHLQRFEHEVTLSPEQALAPELDVQRHTDASVEARQLLDQALGESVEALKLQFETDVERLYYLAHYQGAEIEVCLDCGEVRAGNARDEIYEIEFELKKGSVKSLLAFASGWVKRYKLWLDVRSKAERGDLLAHGLQVSPAVQASAPALNKKDSPETALRKMVNSCLAQILPNAAAIAGGVGRAEHLHQTRIGIRRLRSALRVFGHWSEEVAPGWEPILAELFNQLGGIRDRDALAESLFPRLHTAGAPLVSLSNGLPDDQAGKALRSPEYVRLLLILMAFANTPCKDSADTKSNTSLMEQAEKSIKRLHRQLVEDAAGFRHFQDEQRHRTRKRLKRLRYCVEFVAPLYPKKAIQKYLSHIRPALDALGEFNDLVVAEQLFRTEAEKDQRAWFAVGWIVAQRTLILQDCANALEQLPQAPKFWS